MTTTASFRRIVLIVAILNLGYFGIEFVVALNIGSVSLFADSVDFLEDASINLLIFFAAGWPLAARARMGHILAFVILIPALATIGMLVVKILNPYTPDPSALSITALGALAVNLTAAVLLARHRNAHGSIAKAAWLSARNDSFANLAIILAAIVSLWVVTGWIDIVVGVSIALLNADAARTVWKAARSEKLEVED